MSALAGVSLRVERGQLVALVGPSGSGKTTLLRLLAGFDAPDSGTLRVGGETVAGPGRWVEPEARRVGMVFQSGALFPHLDVAENVRFGAAGPRRADAVLDLVGLRKRSRHYPHELAGGERQRVALARALAADPEVVLLDEPFASLDAGLREQLRGEVVDLLREAGASTLLVTHDQAEALSLADTIAVARDGRIEQSGTPETVYGEPRSRWVAEFLGEAEILPGIAAEGLVDCPLGRFPVPAGLHGPVELVVRPEFVAIGDVSDGGLDARVVGRSFFGHDQLVVVELADGRRLRSRQVGRPSWRPGERVRVSIDGPVTTLADDQRSASTAR